MTRPCIVCLLLVAAPAFAGQAAPRRGAPAPPADAAAKAAATAPADGYEELYARYLQSARALPGPAASPDTSWMAGLMPDLRARRLNDLVTVRVIERIAASGTADSQLDKSSTGEVGVRNLFGVENKAPSWLDPASLAGFGANTDFKGGGATNRTGDLTAVVTARVVEVLPNGDLALEAVREVGINGDRQIIVLTGVVRTADIAPGNVVLSTAMGQMRIRYFGQGLIKDNLQPGWLVRVLNKIF